MVAWCCVLLGLGVAAFMDALFSYGEVFRQLNSVLFMLVSLGLVVRSATKRQLGHRERLTRQVVDKERELRNLRLESDRLIPTSKSRAESVTPSKRTNDRKRHRIASSK
jgi:hypothetical protein